MDPEQPLLPGIQPRETRRVVRTLHVMIRTYHSHVHLYDQQGALMGALTVLTEDVVDLVHLLQPQRIKIAGQSIIGENWVDPPDCTVGPLNG